MRFGVPCWRDRSAGHENDVEAARCLLEGQVGHQTHAIRRAQWVAVSGNQYRFIAVSTLDKRVRLAEHVHRPRYVQGLHAVIDDDRDSLYRHASYRLNTSGLLL